MEDGERSRERQEDEDDDEEEDKRREAAIASASVFRTVTVTSFKSSGRLTSQQLSKLQELHRRRLQIKSDSKVNRKARESTKRCHTKQLNATHAVVRRSPMPSTKDSCASGVEIHDKDDFLSAEQESLAVKPKSQRRQKLHWGLDTKERWERKANM